MDFAQAKKIFDALYGNVSGRNLSLAGRESNQYKSKSFVYGEVVPHSFYQILKDLGVQPGQVFYDLGSGTGKAVVLANLLFDFSESIGIEFVESLYQCSVDIQERLEKEFKPKVRPKQEFGKMSFIHGSFLDVDVSNADIIFMNSTCFQEDLMLALDEKLQEVKPGTLLITLSKTLKSPCFQMYRHQLYEFSWKEATVFFHRKI
jgi:SAM-dependent methyltransferase